MYDNYKDIRGDRAKGISVQLGIDEPSGIAHTGYLVEVREAKDHVRLSAHATSYFREALIYNDRRLETIEIDVVAKEAIKKIYNPEGTIVSLRAPWSREANGYQGPFVETEKLKGRQEEVSREWEKYDHVLIQAEIKLGPR